MSKVVKVNTDAFSDSLERLIVENRRWRAGDLFGEDERLTADGLQKIVACSLEILLEKKNRKKTGKLVRRWTTEEIETLRRLAPTHRIDEIARILNRHLSSVFVKKRDENISEAPVRKKSIKENGFSIWKINSPRSHKKSFRLVVYFGGRQVHLFRHRTEDIARAAAAYALEHAPRFERSGDIDGFKVFVKSWLTAQGYTDYRRQNSRNPRKPRKPRNAKNFCIYKDNHPSKVRTPFFSQIKFCGKDLILGHYKTEENARRVAEFALEHAPRFEDSQNSHDFKLFAKSWAIAQGYRLPLQIRTSSFPLEMKPALEALVELRKTIREKQKTDPATGRKNGSAKYKYWTDEERETLRRLKPTHSRKEIAEILGRTEGTVSYMARRQGLTKKINQNAR